MSVTFEICLLLLLPFWLAFGMPLERQKRTTSAETLGDLTAGSSGILNQNCLPLSNCKQIYDSGLTTSGLYRVNLNDGKGEFSVFCDMSLQGGGWTIIQRRIDNSTSFNLTKDDYDRGFGCFNGNFWLGLEKIHRLTNGDTFELHIGLQRFDTYAGIKFGKAKHDFFRVGDATDNYRLSVSARNIIESTITDSFFIQNGTGFSTSDNDVDNHATTHCAQKYSSGWWYNNCHSSHLNGIYYHDGVHPTATLDGIVWEGFGGTTESLKTSVMAVRPS